MPRPIRIWLEISHHPAFRVGGWAWVRADGDSLTGNAGGDWRIDAERIALAGLLAALAKATGPAPVQLHTASDLVAVIPARIAGAQAGRDPPDANLDLWAQASKVLGGAPVTIVRTSNAAGGPSRFAGAWAELARDKSKSKGAFASPIPKVNLTRFPLP